MPALIELENVSVMRGSKIVLREVSLRVEAGEHIAILGPNGCGKSTLIKTIARECYPLAREGSRMALFGKERWNIFDLRPLMGLVSNDLMTLCTREITGRDVVLSGFFGSIGVQAYQHITPEIKRKADEILALLDVNHLADRPVDEMSSGEARRVLIARALVHDPKALVFDEPTNSLDVFAQHELREMMRKLARLGYRNYPRDPSSGGHHSRDRACDPDARRTHRGGRTQVGSTHSRRAGGSIRAACRSRPARRLLSPLVISSVRPPTGRIVPARRRR